MKTTQSREHATTHDVTDQSFISSREAADILSKSEGYVIKLIQKGSLCGRRDKKTRQWLAEAACVRAQLGERHATRGGAQENKDGHDRDIIEYEIPEEAIADLDTIADLDAVAELDTIADLDAVAELEAVAELDVVADLDAAYELSPFVHEENERQVWYAGFGSANWSPEEVTGAAVKELEAAVWDQSEMQTLITDLAIARHRLESTLIRVGYLEAQVDSYKDQMKLMTEYRTRAAHSIVLRKENEDLRGVIDDRNQEIIARDSELIRKDVLIETIKATWWYRCYCFIWGKNPL